MTLTNEQLEQIKFISREEDMPMFSDEQIQAYAASRDTLDEVLYDLLLLKSENTAVKISGLTIEDTSSYFRRLAQTYRPHNTGNLGG